MAWRSRGRFFVGMTTETDKDATPPRRGCTGATEHIATGNSGSQHRSRRFFRGKCVAARKYALHSRCAHHSLDLNSCLRTRPYFSHPRPPWNLAIREMSSPGMREPFFEPGIRFTQFSRDCQDLSDFAVQSFALRPGGSLGAARPHRSPPSARLREIARKQADSGDGLRIRRRRAASVRSRVASKCEYPRAATRDDCDPASQSIRYRSEKWS